MTKTFTKEQLRQYDGQAGRPAYVAIAGTVYDVSAKSAWQGGQHHGNLAGRDLTATLLEQSPHGEKVLAALPIVGKLAE